VDRGQRIEDRQNVIPAELVLAKAGSRNLRGKLQQESRKKIKNEKSVKQKLSKLSQKFELVAAGFILRFTRNLKIAPTIIILSLLITRYSSLLYLFAKLRREE